MPEQTMPRDYVRKEADKYTRTEALTFAMQLVTFQDSAIPDRSTSDAVIQVAEKFYEFLKGN